MDKWVNETIKMMELPAAAAEHYVPTLLSTLGKEHETDCMGLQTRDTFSSFGGYHPRMYEAPEITAGL